MSRRRMAVLLIAALAAISCALYFNTQRNRSQETQGAALLPWLAGDADAVTAVLLRKGGTAPTVTLHKAGAEWTVAERADYPADVAKLRQLLLALRDARIVEEKTADPARFAVIGVEDPAQPGAAGIEVTMATAKDKHSVIVGKPVGEGSFVRRAGENRSFSVEPAIEVAALPSQWIDTRLIDVPVTRIQSIEAKPADGPAYALRRLKPAAEAFGLDGVPAGRKALEGTALAPQATLLAKLTAEDVAPAGAVDFTRRSEVNLTLDNGDIMTLTGTAAADKHWILVKTSKDGALAAKANGRAFEIAGYRYDAIFKPLEQLLVPKEPPPTKMPASGAAAAKGAPVTGSAARKAAPHTATPAAPDPATAP